MYNTSLYILTYYTAIFYNWCMFPTLDLYYIHNVINVIFEIYCEGFIVINVFYHISYLHVSLCILPKCHYHFAYSILATINIPNRSFEMSTYGRTVLFIR